MRSIRKLRNKLIKQLAADGANGSSAADGANGSSAADGANGVGGSDAAGVDSGAAGVTAAGRDKREDSRTSTIVLAISCQGVKFIDNNTQVSNCGVLKDLLHYVIMSQVIELVACVYVV